MSHSVSQGAGAGASERTIGQLVADASRDLSALVRAEIALAKSEITAEVKQGAIGAGLFVGAAVFGAAGGLFVLLAIAWLLSEWLPYWAGFGIVAVVLLLVAGVLAVIGRGRIKKVGAPERTIATSKQSVEALKGHR
ncbi:phage holin family protein [Quadrisphaera sp. KR29]|uniref:phage holin family protein n=1 Tax=Quadrisphaera sp. KR29 TaxID=3461391 RepID=UPI004043EEA1